MNREIKFRAWDGEEMRGKSVTLAEFFEFADGKDWPLMQFTGFYDKYGKEIYEGDIVTKDSEGKYRAEVKWGDAEFYFAELHIGSWLDDWNFPDDSYTMEVIGNIYENPKLLKV